MCWKRRQICLENSFIVLGPGHLFEMLEQKASKLFWFWSFLFNSAESRLKIGHALLSSWDHLSFLLSNQLISTMYNVSAFACVRACVLACVLACVCACAFACARARTYLLLLFAMGEGYLKSYIFIRTITNINEYKAYDLVKIFTFNLWSNLPLVALILTYEKHLPLNTY